VLPGGHASRLGADCAKHKRPTVDRRFFADDRSIATALEEALKRGTKRDSHFFRYQRFLEYTKERSGLDPHTDGTKVCDDTKCVSTHTLSLYLTNCTAGGETLLLKQCSYCLEQKDNLIYATQPKRGRVLLFPHSTSHAGASVVDVPKICLRAEVYLKDKYTS
jgi:hypothetical protein